MSPTASASPTKISDAQKRINLIEKLKATKRANIGFDDFDSSPDRKIARHRVKAEIAVVRKRQGRDDRRGVDDCRSESQTAKQGEACERLSLNSRDELPQELQLHYGKTDHDVEQQRASTAERVCPDEQLNLVFQDGERIAQDQCDEINVMSIEARDVTENRDRLPSHPRTRMNQACHHKEHDPIRNSEDDTSKAVNNLGASRHCEQRTQSLVSCDYSSNDSDN